MLCLLGGFTGLGLLSWVKWVKFAGVIFVWFSEACLLGFARSCLLGQVCCIRFAGSGLLG